MFVESSKAEEQAVLNLAYALCAAVRTAPKACGVDIMDTAILTGDDKARLADEMRRLAGEVSSPIFTRDAGNVDASGAVVLVGIKCQTRGLNEKCGLCGFANCAACTQAGATCVFAPLDLGIALGSAVALAASAHADNRIMFTAGKAAASLGLLGAHSLVMAIPLAISGKSPFFDRK